MNRFTPALVEACQRVLARPGTAASLFGDAVFAEMGGADCQASWLCTRHVPIGTGFFQDGFPVVSGIVEQLKRSPRGCYVVFRFVRQGLPDVWSVRISGGNGFVYGGGKSERYDDEPSVDQVLKSLIAAEATLCREELVAQEFVVRNQQAIRDWGLHPGYTFKRTVFAGQAPFTSGIIEKVENQGMLIVALSRQGHHRPCQKRCSALELIQAAALSASKEVSRRRSA